MLGKGEESIYDIKFQRLTIFLQSSSNGKKRSAHCEATKRVIEGD
jgi:hypothetical protein